MLDPRVPKKPYFARQLWGVSTEGVNDTSHIPEASTLFPLGEFRSENEAIGICMKEEMR